MKFNSYYLTKTISKSLLTLPILLLFVSTTIFPQQKKNNKNEEFKNYLDSYYEIKNIPSISAGVLLKDSIIWLGSKGYTDLENNVPATVNSVYRIASISKPITAIAIMQLWEKGLIYLDDDVRKYVPYFPQKKWSFTIRQLLSHSSGIRNYKPGEFHSKAYFSSTREALKVFSADTLEFRPGTEYQYSTLGYTLLAAVVESVTKMPFGIYVYESILKPSGMSSTFVDVQKNIVPNRARGYIKSTRRELENSQLADLSLKVAGGGFISTSRDLLLFAKSILNGTLIKTQTLDTMLVPLTLGRNRVQNYGLGFSLPEIEGPKYFEHSGSGTGFTSKLKIYPNEKLATVHLINLNDRNLEVPADELANIQLNKIFIKPRLTASDTLMSYYLRDGIEGVYSKLTSIFETDSSSYSMKDFDLSIFGKDLVLLNKNNDAISYLKFISKLYPNSASIHTVIGDAYIADGNKGLALKNYKIAFQIDPKEKYLRDTIRKLTK